MFVHILSKSPCLHSSPYQSLLLVSQVERCYQPDTEAQRRHRTVLELFLPIQRKRPHIIFPCSEQKTSAASRYYTRCMSVAGQVERPPGYKGPEAAVHRAIFESCSSQSTNSAPQEPRICPWEIDNLCIVTKGSPRLHFLGRKKRPAGHQGPEAAGHRARFEAVPANQRTPLTGTSLICFRSSQLVCRKRPQFLRADPGPT
jgi:hypothetical protein